MAQSETVERILDAAEQLFAEIWLEVSLVIVFRWYEGVLV